MTAAKKPVQTPRERGEELARGLPPLTDEQVEAAARILASVERERE